MKQLIIEDEPFAITKWFSGVYKSDKEYGFTVIMRASNGSGYIADTITWLEYTPADNYVDLLKIEEEIKKVANGKRDSGESK